MTPHAYVREQLSIILGTPVMPSDALAARVYTLLSREEEHHAPTTGHGTFPHESSVLFRLGLLEQPPLHAEIAALARQHPGTPRWPHGHRFAACLTHDVDRIVKLPWRERFRQAACIRNTSLYRRFRWAAMGAVYAAGTLLRCSDPAPYDYWLDEEARHGFRSTFFVLPEQPLSPTAHDHFYRYNDLIRLRGINMTFAQASRLVRELGWEIGLHGSYASALDAAAFRHDKVQLETMLGAPVVSTRQHYLRFRADTTPALQAAAGIRADTTLGYSRTIGCRAGLAFPYFWPGDIDLLEVPLIIQDVGLLRVRQEPPEKAIQHAQALITTIAEAGGVVTLSWHTHPESPGAHASYRALLDTIAELGGWGCTLGELDAWWRARRAAVRNARTDISIPHTI